MGVCCVWKAEEEEDEGTGGGEGAALITDNHQSIRPQEQTAIFLPSDLIPYLNGSVPAPAG